LQENRRTPVAQSPGGDPIRLGTWTAAATSPGFNQHTRGGAGAPRRRGGREPDPSACPPDDRNRFEQGAGRSGTTAVDEFRPMTRGEYRQPSPPTCAGSGGRGRSSALRASRNLLAS
jgi:hypothetical protein